MPERFPRDMLASLPTPCLLIDLDAVDRNIARAVSLTRGTGIALRPHFKAHKTTMLMQRQLAAGASGATCQTPREALVLAMAGVSDILVANEVADQRGLAILGEAARISSVSVAADAIDHVDLLADTAERAGAGLKVLIELDVGSGRAGLGAGSDRLIPLAEAIAGQSRLHFAGLLAYEGHVMAKEDRSARATALWQVASQVAHEAGRLRAKGFDVALITGGGTGTLDLVPHVRSHNEAQPGSYVLMDATYGRLGLEFEQSLFCVATVVSRRTATSGVLNAGLKSISGEQGLPVATKAGMRIVGMADEHARFVTAEDAGLSIGDPLLLVPPHVDPTVNLHPVLHVWDGHELTTGRLTDDESTDRVDESRP